MNYDLTPAEEEIMAALWENGRWMTIHELIEHFSSLGKDWKRQTINTFLVRLAKKGLIVKNGKKYIYAYTKEEYNALKASGILDSLYGGSLKDFVSALSGSHKLTPEEAKELKQYLDQMYP